MKCSHCYAENPPWATVCSSCGRPVLRLEICPNGHLLPPGMHDCPVCPSLWPEVDAFAGPPVLRGLLWVEKGRLAAAAEAGNELAYLEVRDRESPLVLKGQQSGTAYLAAEDDPEADCRILMRPEGLRMCRKNRPEGQSGPLTYEPIPPGGRFSLGSTTFRHVAVAPPPWVEKLAGTLRRRD